MAKKNNVTIADLIGNIKEDITGSNKQEGFIPDIITFCEDPNWLALGHSPTNPIFLYPTSHGIQQVV